MPRIAWRFIAALIVIVACAAGGLMWLALNALQRQSEAIARLIDANRRLGAERLIAELEYETREGVERCLKLLDPLNIRPEVERSRTPGCSYVNGFFVLEAQRLRYSSGSEADAARLQRDLAHPGVLLPTRVYSLAYPDHPITQIFFTRARSGRGEYLVAVSVDPDEIRGHQMTRAQLLAGVQGSLESISAEQILNGSASHFRSLFPFWQVTVTPEAPPSTGLSSLPLFTWITLCTGSVLLLGLGILLWQNWRYWRLGEMRIAFVTGAAHELKTPLAGLRFYTDLVTNPSFDAAERGKFAQVVIDEVREMTRRIDKVLQFARIGSRGRIYELQLANLSSIVTGVLDRWRSRFEQQGVQIEADVANGVPLVNMDPAAVSDALLNLLDNAAKYSDASRPVHVLVFARSRHAVLEVRDYGPGIPQSEQSHLFEAFYRNPRDSGKGGFGLGLFLVKHIVEGHGGAVELDSKPGQGSSFRLLFPLHEQDPDRRG